MLPILLVVSQLAGFAGPAIAEGADVKAGGVQVAPAGTTERTPAVAVLDFANLSDYGGPVVGRNAAAAVAQSMEDTENWEVLRSDAVARAMVEEGLVPPLDVTGIRKLGRALGADAVVTGQVTAVVITDTPKRAQVGLMIEMRDVASGELINGASEIGISGYRPGYTGDAEPLVNEAIRKAAFAGVTKMSQQTLPRGTVLNTSVTPGGTFEMLLNVGANAGVSVGQEFIVLRGGEQVGRIRVVRVEATRSTAVMVEQTKGIRPEDKVQAVFKMPPAPQITVVKTPTGEQRSVAPPPAPKRGKGIGAYGAAIAGAALLALIFKGRTKSGRVGTEARATSIYNNPSIGVPENQVAIIVKWDVPNNVRYEDIIEFDIYRSDGSYWQPVGVVDRNTRWFVDTEVVRDVSVTEPTDYSGPTAQPAPGATTDTTTGGTTTGGTTTGGTTTGGTTGTTGTTANQTSWTGVQGIVAGRTYQYAVRMVYYRPDVSGQQTGAAGGVTTGQIGVGTTTGTTTTERVIKVTPLMWYGPVTAILPPTPTSPAGGNLVQDITDVTFQWDGVTGANEYILEVADNPDFRNSIQLGPVLKYGTAAVGAQTLAGQDISRMRRTNSGNVFWWRVGARNRYDNPGPDPGIWGKLGGDRRWVYSQPETFTIPG
ncbi:MAG: hypothetical protein ACUVTZ_06785 [Armatimonadota bacterium]